MQPPLPLDPPPQDRPLTPLITSPKKEIMDEEENDDSISSINSIGTIKIKTEPNTTVELQPNETNNADETDNNKKSDKPICKDFLRNKCIRRNCLYRHEYDKNLVYSLCKFCKDFQNKGYCKYQNCKYLHATVYEQERFYEGFPLPQRAYSHLKANNPTVPNNNGAITEGIDKTLLQCMPIGFRKTPPPPPPVDDTVVQSKKCFLFLSAEQN